MNIRLQDQAAALVLSLFMGAALGLVYDLLRPPRRGARGAAGVCLDALFCLIAGAAAFCFAMAAGDGRLGTWELGCAAAGFVLYMHTLSAITLPAAEALYRALGRARRRGGKFLKKSADLAKSLFQKALKCFIIKSRE